MRKFVMASRPVAHGHESEPVVVDTDTPGVVRLEVGEGLEFEMDEVELRAALDRKAA